MPVTEMIGYENEHICERFSSNLRSVDLWCRRRTWAERGRWDRRGGRCQRGGWCRRGENRELSRFYDDLRLSTFDSGTCAGGGASLCPGVRVRGCIRASRGIYSSLCSRCRVAAQATVPRSGSGHPTGLIADSRRHTSVCLGVYSGVRGRSGNRSTPGIYPGLCGSGRVTA